MCLEAEYVMPETNDIPEQPSMVCETCGRNLQRSRQCWECGRLQCKHCAYWCTHCPSGSDKYTICSYCFLLGIYLRKKGKIWTCRRCRVLSETECDRDMRHACKKQVRGHGKGNAKGFFAKRRRYRKGKRRWRFEEILKQAGIPCSHFCINFTNGRPPSCTDELQMFSSVFALG